MPHKYKDPKTGQIKTLSQDDSLEFDYLIKAMKEEDITTFMDILKDTPIVVHTISERTGSNCLHYATLHANENGLKYFNILLERGADLSHMNGNTSVIDRISIIKGPYRQKFLDAAYRHARAPERAAIDELRASDQRFAEYARKEAEKKAAYDRARTFDEKLAIDPLRATSEYIEGRKEDTETINKMIGKKKGFFSSIFSFNVQEINNDNNLLNHPRIQQIMEVANSQKLVNQLLDITQDKEVASSLTSAIDEKYAEEIEALLADGADPEVLESISKAIYSMKAEEVLKILFSKPEITEASNSIDSLITTVESEQLQSNSKGLFGDIGEAVEIMSKYLSTLLEQNINGKLLEDGIKTLEVLLYFAQMSGGMGFVGGYHGYNGDDFDGDNGGGNAGIAFEHLFKPNLDEAQVLALNITYAIDSY
ncbi:MAG: hypothetical protein AABY27_06395 [Pseudomonadota bacterium]